MPRWRSWVVWRMKLRSASRLRPWEGHVEALVDGFLEVADGDGGGVGDGLCELDGVGFEVFSGGYGVEEADFEGFPGGEGASGEEEVEGVGASDDSGESLSSAVPGDEALGEG